MNKIERLTPNCNGENLLQVIVAVGIIFLSYYFLIYPLYLSPLSKIPGPLLYKITNVLNLNDQRVESRNEKLHQWHKKYPVVQIGPKEISLSSAKSLKQIYVQKNLKKTTFYRQYSNFGEHNAFSTQDSKPHIKRKRMMTKVYTKTAVFSESSQKHINGKVLQVIKFIEDRLGQSVDVYDLFNSLAMDVVTYYELGPQFTTNLITDLKERKIIESFRASSSMWFYTTLLPRLWSLAASKEISRECERARTWIKDKFLMVYQALEKTKSSDNPESSENSEKSENSESLENSEDPSLAKVLFDLGVSKWAIGSELFDHIAAGHETTGTSLAYATWELSRPCNRYLQDFIYNEVKENFGKEPQQAIDLGKLDKLVFMDAFFSELTRVHAAIPGSEPREVTEDLKFEVELEEGNKIKLPKGTIVSVQPWTIHRDPSVFADPDIFNPERWLQQVDETDEEFKERYKLMKSMMFAFGQGNRMCLGMNLAVIEIKLAIAHLYWRFNSEISSKWCSKIENGPTIMGASKLKGKKKEEMSDIELMTMADSYTSRPLFNECWLEWKERPL